MSDPQKMENIISMVRTVTPLTSAQTVTKVNTYLPLFEKVSTLLGMYTFLNRAQTFRPIEPLNANSPGDMINALMKNKNVPVGKLLAQPFIANNMDKIVGSVASSMLKNGGLNELLKNNNLADMLSNGNLNDMLSAFTDSSNKGSTENNNIDLNSLMETFMPMLNSMSTESPGGKENNKNYDYNLKNESFLPDEDNLEEDYYEKQYHDYKYDKHEKENKYDKAKNDKYDEDYKNDRYEGYDKTVNYNDNKNSYKYKENQKPIRIKQRKRR